MAKFGSFSIGVSLLLQLLSEGVISNVDIRGMTKCGSFALSASFLLLSLTEGIITRVDIREAWNGQYVNRSDVSHQLVDTLRHIMLKLRWRRICVIFDNESNMTVRELLLHQDSDILPASFLLQELNHELLSESAFKSFLQSVHQRFFPELNFILLGDYKESVKLLGMVDSVDKELNRTTDFRHYSFWIQACTSVCQPPPGPHPEIYHLENVILLSPSNVQNECIDVWELKIITNGRTFTLLKNEGDLIKMDMFQNTKHTLNNRTLIVSTIEDDPTFSKKTKTGYEGYCIEVLEFLASMLNFSYEIINPMDNAWGGETNGTWNGLTGQLQRREVDLVIASLSVHQDREKVMDFLYPPFFIEFDDIAYRLPPSDGVRWNMFFASFQSTVFIVLGASFISVNVLVYTFMRYSGSNMPCVGAPRIMDVVIYSLGMLLNRGVAVVSSRQSTRLLLFTWGVFSVIFAAAYSANLVAIFAVHRQQLPFKNLGELVRQTEYKWGFVSGNIREHIFRLSKTGDMELAWKGILQTNKSDPDVLSSNSATHINKLKTEKYALFGDRFFMRTLRKKDCNIMLVGEDILMNQYAIGVPTGYPLSRDIEEKLSILADSGLLDIWWQRWGTGKPVNCVQEDRVTALSLSDVTSAFVLLGAGLGFAGLVLLIEQIRNIPS